MNKHFNTGQHDNIVRGLFRPTLLSRGLAALKAWRNRRVAIRTLDAMPDALLRDIGIERYQIKDAVHNVAARPEVIRMRGEKIVPALQTRKAA